MQGTSIHLTLPSFQFPLPLPPPSLSFLSSLLPLPPPPTQWCNIPITNTFQHLYKDTKFYCCKEKANVHVWQSWVEVKHYSVAYFDCIIKYCKKNFIEGGAQTHYVDLSGVHVSILCLSSTHMRSSALQHFKRLVLYVTIA